MTPTAGLVGALAGRFRSGSRRTSPGRAGDAALYGLCLLAALLAAGVLVVIAYQVINGASSAISAFGLGFIGRSAWKANFGVFGAATLLYGSAISSLMALALAVPIGISIGLFLSLLAPRRVSAVIGPLVEMLAAIPSVILGFWGILILAPFLQAHAEPWLHSVFGFIPIFGTPSTVGSSLFTAGLILTIMVVPIIASISRDLFLTVPSELQDAATALGATRWEMIRGVVLPSAAPGVVAAAFLGLGRALGEAIAVTQVIGGGTAIHASLFATADTLASRIAEEFGSAASPLHTAALFYLGVILLVIGLLSNALAQWIASRFKYGQGITA
jgi:phosphate transport system permease protein